MQTTRCSLLLRIKNRQDDASWRQFDEIYRPMLYQFAISRGLKDAEAEDVVQFCMAAIQEQIHAFDYDPSRGRFKGWLRTLVNNRVRNLVRNKHEQPAESAVFQRPAQQATPEEEFDRLWMIEHLKHAMRAVQAEVGETAFQVFQMYVMEQQPVEEICKKLGVDASQIHKTKFRLTRKLAEKLAELGEEASP